MLSPVLLHQLEFVLVLKYVKVREYCNHGNIAELEVVEECFLRRLDMSMPYQRDAVPDTTRIDQPC